MKRCAVVVPVAAFAMMAGAESFRPETWFHVIGGNFSKEGIVADLDAIKAAGIGGIQFFHGNGDGTLWPGVKENVPCMSEKWLEYVKFTAEECHRRGLTFKMQNCPGWSMSGGPWIPISKAMRRLVAFEPGRRPEFTEEDDYHEIATVEFPIERETMLTLPPPTRLNHAKCYQMEVDFVVKYDGREVKRIKCPKGSWQDAERMTFGLGKVYDHSKLAVETEAKHEVSDFTPEYSDERRLDHWEPKAARCLRSFTMSKDERRVASKTMKTLVIGHVNAKRKNHPAPPEATGWECDKLDPAGFEENFRGYLGKVIAAGVKIDGTLVDSWECEYQNWTWKMEEEFRKRAGYELKPHLPSLFGYIVDSPAATEKFLLDWRNVISRMIEENYYGTIARLAREHNMHVQYETGFGDDVNGDPMRFWKPADETMCEFWSPHDDNGFVGSHDFKSVIPAASAAHLYGKRRVSAESLTSFNLTFDENFKLWKNILDMHFARGVTHIVFHTYTHNPVVGGKPPSTSFGCCIGSPILREQTFWPFMKDFTDYIAWCGEGLERGHAVIDILRYLGDEVAHIPSEIVPPFENEYKVDYLNQDALLTRLSVKDGRFTLPDGMSYRVIWIPEDTFLLPGTEKKLAEFTAAGGRIIRGDFKPDWPSPLRKIGRSAKDVLWYERKDGDEDRFFVVEKATDRSCFMTPVELKPEAEYPAYETKRVYRGVYSVRHGVPLHGGGDDSELARRCVLDLGEVKDWAIVKVGGKEVARLWCEPYEVELTPYLGNGTVEIEVEVTSSWYNRLAYDAGLPEAERKTWTLCGPGKGAKMRPAGLLGPVTVAERIR